MRIGLTDVDGHHFPNLALMKIAAYHKSIGDSVEWASPLFGHYDRVYKSKVFTFTPDDDTPYACEVVKGGTGYGMYEDLPEEIDGICPDYSIYPQFTAAYGFLTRGCPNRCPWCIVPKKEGSIRAYSDIEEEKQSLFREMAIEGKRWNAEKKVVEGIPKPCEFKKGEPVLVRSDYGRDWMLVAYVELSSNPDAVFGKYGVTDGRSTIFYRFCLPYNEKTMHLLGTTNDYVEE